MRCARDPGLGEMYALVRSEALLAQRLSALTHQARASRTNSLSAITRMCQHVPLPIP